MSTAAARIAMKPHAKPMLRQALAWVAVLAVLAAVFGAYLNPHLAVDLANQLWACF